MSTCNRLDLQTLGCQPVVMPKILPDHWFSWSCSIPMMVSTWPKIVGATKGELETKVGQYVCNQKKGVHVSTGGCIPSGRLVSFGFRILQLKRITHPQLLVHATSERFLQARATFRSYLASESHWLQPLLVLADCWWPDTSKCGWASSGYMEHAWITNCYVTDEPVGFEKQPVEVQDFR